VRANYIFFITPDFDGRLLLLHVGASLFSIEVQLI
jgi:hypothetical protein